MNLINNTSLGNTSVTPGGVQENGRPTSPGKRNNANLTASPIASPSAPSLCSRSSQPSSPLPVPPSETSSDMMASPSSRAISVSSSSSSSQRSSSGHQHRKSQDVFSPPLTRRLGGVAVPKLNLDGENPNSKRFSLPKPPGKPMGQDSPLPTTQRPRAQSQVGFSDGLNNTSASAPTTPRSSTSPREKEEWQGSRHRVNSLPRKPTSPRSSTQPEVMPSPRRTDPERIERGREAASLMLEAMQARLKTLKPENIASLARTEFTIPMKTASVALLKCANTDASSGLSHAKLINALFAKPLLDSQVGKAMLTLRKVVMEQYDGYDFKLEDYVAMSDQAGFKQRQMHNMEAQANACAKIFFEMDRCDLSSSKLPQELIAFWKEIDEGLCKWASENNGLSRDALATARSNLGFDLLVTRLAMPMLSGSEQEAGLVISHQFCSAVKNAILGGWPDFFERFLVATGLERASQERTARSSAATASTIITTSIANPTSINTSITSSGDPATTSTGPNTATTSTMKGDE